MLMARRDPLLHGSGPSVVFDRVHILGVQLVPTVGNKYYMPLDKVYKNQDYVVPERRATKCAGRLTIVLAGTYVPIAEYPTWGGPCL